MGTAVRAPAEDARRAHDDARSGAVARTHVFPCRGATGHRVTTCCGRARHRRELQQVPRQTCGFSSLDCASTLRLCLLLVFEQAERDGIWRGLAHPAHPLCVYTVRLDCVTLHTLIWLL